MVQKCIMGASGGLSETTLWENQSPSSSFTYQTITLSKDITTFKYIGIEFKASTSISDEQTVMVTPEELYASERGKPCTMITSNGASGGTYGRMVTKSSNTSLYISPAYRMSADGVDDSTTIPLRVIGYK